LVASVFFEDFAMCRYESPFRYPDEHMRLLGLISAHWEGFERVMEVILAEIMSHEHGRVALLTSHVSFANKMDLITIYVRDAYGNDSEDPVWKDYNLLAARVRRAYGDRNKYIHAQWGLDPSGNLLRHDIRIKGGKLNLGNEVTTTDMLAGTAKEIADAGATFVEFFRRLGIDPTLRKKSS
jgi:hypothetical protein